MTEKGEDIFFLPDLEVSGTPAFNGGCEYEKTVGWEPVIGLVGRPLRFFKDFGGNAHDIPEKYKRYELSETPDKIDWELWADGGYDKFHLPKLDIVTNFPEISLPRDCNFLWNTSNTYGMAAQKYITTRSKWFERYNGLLWSPQYKKYIIIPFVYKKKIIGWIARRIDDDGLKHIKCTNFPTDYMYNQEIIYRRNNYIVVQEGALDAMVFHTLCTFGAKLSPKQINLLNNTGKNIILLPDYKKNEWKSYWETAKENNWFLSCPIYPGSRNDNDIDHIKDAGESLSKNGLLLTTEVIMKSITKDYDRARMIYVTNSR
jgi:hypothetical protein